jgi:hypothetical protein
MPNAPFDWRELRFSASLKQGKAWVCALNRKTPEKYLEIANYPRSYISPSIHQFSFHTATALLNCYIISTAHDTYRNWTPTLRDYSINSHTEERKDASHVHHRCLWQARLHTEEGRGKRSHQVRPSCTILAR